MPMTNEERTALRRERYAQPKDPNDPRHGTAGFYTNHGCKCGPCRLAQATYAAERDGRKPRDPDNYRGDGTEPSGPRAHIKMKPCWRCGVVAVPVKNRGALKSGMCTDCKPYAKDYQ